MTDQPILPFEEWLVLNEMKPTKRARKIWAQEQEVRPILWLLAQKLGVQTAEVIKMPEVTEEYEPVSATACRGKSRLVKWGAAVAAAVCIICMSIVLPITLGGGSGLALPGESEYANVSVDNETDLDTIRKRKDILLFHPDNIVIEGQVSYDKPIGKKEPILSYKLEDFYIIAGNNTVLFIIEEYRVRLHKKYNFIKSDYYESVNKNYTIGGIEVNYTTEDILSNYITFTHGGYDYFIKVSKSGSPINEQNLIYLMETLCI